MTLLQDLLWLSLKGRIAKESENLSIGSLNRIHAGILEWVALRADSEGPLFIQEIVKDSGVASPATIFKALNALKRKGLLRIEVDSSDTRRRSVSVTQKAVSELKAQDKLLRSWIKGNQGKL